MMEIYLYRMKVGFSNQLELFGSRPKPSEVIRQAINSAPSTSIREGITWHIGNVAEIDMDSLYFRFGKSKEEELPRFKGARFFQEYDEVSPFTHILVDVPLEIAGIAYNYKLGKDTKTIASRLSDTLNDSSVIRQYNARLSISPIADSRKFIDVLINASRIHRFWYTVARPNLDDVDEDWIKPVEKIVKDLDGKSGKVTVDEDDREIDRGAAGKLARHVSASGEDCGATVTEAEGEKRRRVRLGSRAEKRDVEDLEDPEAREGAITTIRTAYHELRDEADLESETRQPD